MCAQACTVEHLFYCFISHLSTQNPDAAAADKSPDVIPGNEDVDAGPDSVSYLRHTTNTRCYCVLLSLALVKHLYGLLLFSGLLCVWSILFA